MTYESATALRMALEQRLSTRSAETGISLDRLRRRVVFERIISRLQANEPGAWVVKGGMALEVRLSDRARLTKDLDLGLRDHITDGAELQERLVEALAIDPDGDRFEIAVGPVKPLMEDGAGHLTWRVSVSADLAGKLFGRIPVDISPRAAELHLTDLVELPNSLAFAGITTSTIELVDIHRHAAEKFHGMQKDFGDRENTRVRDLVDIILLIEYELIETPKLSIAVRQVWSERDGASPPQTLPPPPDSWSDRYESLANEHELETASFPAAVALTGALWSQLSQAKEH